MAGGGERLASVASRSVGVACPSLLLKYLFGSLRPGVAGVLAGHVTRSGLRD